MKKIALVFYGLLRDMEKAYPYWKDNVIDPLNIKDIYAHTYRDEEEITKVNNTGQFSFKLGPSVLTEFYKLYKPKVVMHSEYDDVKKTKYWFEPIERVRFCLSPSGIYTTQSIFFSMYNAINLIPKNTYDYVILSMVDQIFNRSLRDEEINTEENELLTSNFMWFKNWDNSYWTNTNFFVIGNLKTVKKYADIGINYKQLYDSGITFHPEILLGENLRKQDVKTTPYFIYPFDHHYIRNHEEITNMIQFNKLDTWSPMTFCYKNT